MAKQHENKNEKKFTLHYFQYPTWRAEANAREKASQDNFLNDYAERRRSEFSDGAFSNNAYYRAKSGLDTF